MGTNLTKFEERSLEGEFVYNGSKYQARDDLRRLSSRPVDWGTLELTGHRLSANHPKPATMKSIHWV